MVSSRALITNLVNPRVVTEKSVRRQKRSPRTNLAAKTGPPLPISVPHENVILQPSMDDIRNDVS